ncbi:multicomponent Na+:H+ antiporter subunit F [Rhodococcus triatomae]|uniref:Multicomponent Na+:H+ antiporter subunit F n=1 Tax=Rhodococcus triatomae TaxID=300028 RepID=A0A1G8IJJ1_9NOCA|nr:monovalent cation/H+ antiporter complex subunit F [Rhodococcus triatomae]SDI19075.1 multicomponent Na+:H+ antiporter subunit F [Rhodococcus triatomae]
MNLVVWTVLVVVALTMVPAAWRIHTGPTDADRAVATDLIFFAFVGVVALLGTQLAEGVVFDVILVATVVGFLATMSMARLVTRGRR